MHSKKFKTQEVDAYLSLQLGELYCKHVLSLSSSSANMLLQESLNTGYEYCQWGNHETTKDRLNLSHHLDKIERMEKEGYEHAIRIVICKYPFSLSPVIWVDNLHSAVLQIRKNGLGVTLGEIPFYIVDISNPESPRIMSYNNSFINTEENRKGVLECAYKRYNRSNSKALVAVNYRVKDFIRDNYELYTYHNKVLCKEKENPSFIDLVSRSMAFNSFWNP